MNQWNDDRIRETLKAAFPPATDSGLPRDLWPQMLSRIAAPAPRVPWLDWAVAALSALAFLLLPGAAHILFYFL